MIYLTSVFPNSGPMENISLGNASLKVFMMYVSSCIIFSTLIISIARCLTSCTLDETIQ